MAFTESLEWGREGGGFGAHQGVKEPGLGLRGVVRPHMLSGSGFSHLASLHNSRSLLISCISWPRVLPHPKISGG